MTLVYLSSLQNIQNQRQGEAPAQKKADYPPPLSLVGGGKIEIRVPSTQQPGQNLPFIFTVVLGKGRSGQFLRDAVRQQVCQ